MAEAEARTSWAQNLGKGISIGTSDIDSSTFLEAPPSYGMWDLARAPKHKPLNKEKVVNEIIIKAILNGENDGAVVAKKLVRQSASSPCRPKSDVHIATSAASLSSPQRVSVIAEGLSPGHQEVEHPTSIASHGLGPGPAASAVRSHGQDPGPALLATRRHSDGVVGCTSQPPMLASESKRLRSDVDGKLRNFVLQILGKQERLWSWLDAHERQLRSSCLCDQLCRLAQAKYKEVVTEPWDAYLRTTRGRERITAWVQKKVGEHMRK
jgi:hypothetical protein